MLLSCAKGKRQIDAADITCHKSRSATCTCNSVNNNNNIAATSANRDVFSDIAVGHVCCLHKWDEVEVDILACNPDYRVYGAGTALMTHV